MIIPANNCWSKCLKSGDCFEHCGFNGYCCRKGWSGCSAGAEAAASGSMHACIKYVGPKTTAKVTTTRTVPKTFPHDWSTAAPSFSGVSGNCACEEAMLPQVDGLLSWVCERDAQKGECTCGMECTGTKGIIPDQVTCGLTNDNMRSRFDPLSNITETEAEELRSDMGLGFGYDLNVDSYNFDWSYSRTGIQCPKDICVIRQSGKPVNWRSNPMIDQSTQRNIRPRGANGRWKLTFSDEFNAPEINKDRWTKVDGHRGWFRSKRDPKFKYSWFWKPQNIRVKEGEAILDFKHEFTNEKDTWFVSSGNLNTDCKFEQKYGFFEAKILHVKPLAKQAAFWMMPHKGLLAGASAKEFQPTGNAAKGAELDIFEGNNAFVEKFATNIHWDGYGKFHQGSPKYIWTWRNGKKTLNTEPIRYHTYGLEWTPTKLIFYYDGQKVREETNSKAIPHVKQYMIVSGGIFDDGWVTGTIPGAPWPDSMKVDYVRAWARNE